MNENFYLFVNVLHKKCHNQAPKDPLIIFCQKVPSVREASHAASKN